MTGWRSRLARVAVATLLTLGGLELALRAFWIKHGTLGAGIDHPHFHHRLHPGELYRFTSEEFNAQTRTNSYGLRGLDPVIPKPPGVFRILMLGDSFTFGFPVKDEETFCALVQQALRAQGYPVEVVNGGVSGASPTLHYISLRDQFLTFEPDLAVLWYDLGDLQEDHWFQKNLLYDQAGAIVRADPRYVNGRFAWWEWMQHHSGLCTYIEKKVLNTIRKARILGPIGYARVILRGERAKVAIARLKRGQRSADLADADRFLLVREDSTRELVEPYWRLSERYLDLIRELLEARDIPFVVGAYPYGMVVGPDQWADGRQYWGFERGRTYDPSLALALLGEYAQTRRLTFVSVYGAFREAAKSAKLFYDGDGHFTPAGHQTVARALVGDPGFIALLRRRIAARSDLAAAASARRRAL